MSTDQGDAIKLDAAEAAAARQLAAATGRPVHVVEVEVEPGAEVDRVARVRPPLGRA
jgi:hypothetical protein